MGRRTRAGELDKRVLVKRHDGTKTSAFEINPDGYTITVGTFWGKLSGVSDGDPSPANRQLAAGVSPNVTHVIKLRYNESVTNDCRATIGSTHYHIDAIVHDPSRHEDWTLLYCVRVMT